MYLRMDKEKHEEIMEQIHMYKWTIPKIISNLEGEISELRRLEDLSLPKICTVLREELNLEVSSGNLSTILRRLKPVEGEEENSFLREAYRNRSKLVTKRHKETKVDDVNLKKKSNPIEDNSVSKEINEKGQKDTKPDDELEQKNLTENFDNFSLEELPI